MDSTREVKQKLTKLKVRLKRRYPISSMALFGSYARNEQTEFSDIDIIVEFNGRIGSRFIDLANELEKSLGLKVDLISKNGIKDRHLETIQSDLIYV